MTPAVLTALALWAVVLTLVVIAVFIVKLLLRFERAASHFDFTLSQLDRIMPLLSEQSQKTLQSLELTSGQARKLMTDIEKPIKQVSSPSGAAKTFLSPEVITAIIGLLKGFNFFKRTFAGKGQAGRQA